MQVSEGLAAEGRRNLLLIKHRTRQQCLKLVPRLLRAIADLRSSGFAALCTLGESFASWRRDRMHVAVYAHQWDYRRFPYEDRTTAALGIWVPQFPELSFAG